MDSNLPITGVCVISDPTKCPPNYEVIDKTFDKQDDADLWRDSLFSRRVMRYLCVEKQIPSPSQDVLVDVTLINEKDLPPPGFTVLDYTHDNRERATKKKYIGVRWMVPSMTSDAITDLILVTRYQRRAPIGYTMVGDVNNMSLCYKMGRVPASLSSRPENGSQGQTQNAQEAPPYSMTPLTNNLPYAVTPVGAGPASNAAPDRLERAQSVVSAGILNALSGVQWRMNPRYNALLELQDVRK